MTEQEKIKSILEDHAKNNNNDYQNLISMIADDIIKAFPQITKKPVKVTLSQDYSYTKEQDVFYIKFNELNLFWTIEKRKEWIDSHYVEVV